MSSEVTHIAIASLNPIKVSATQTLFKQVKLFNTMEFDALSVASGVAEQPIGLAEITQGAKNRAYNAFCKGDFQLAVGIESGIFQLPPTDDYFDVCVVSIYNGQQHHLGLSSAFMLPSSVSSCIFEKNVDLSQALNLQQFTTSDAIGSEEGAIGIFSKGRITRQLYTQQAILTALIPFENNFCPSQSVAETI